MVSVVNRVLYASRFISPTMTVHNNNNKLKESKFACQNLLYFSVLFLLGFFRVCVRFIRGLVYFLILYLLTIWMGEWCDGKSLFSCHSSEVIRICVCAYFYFLYLFLFNFFLNFFEFFRIHTAQCSISSQCVDIFPYINVQISKRYWRKKRKEKRTYKIETEPFPKC